MKNYSKLTSKHKFVLKSWIVCTLFLGIFGCTKDELNQKTFNADITEIENLVEFYKSMKSYDPNHINLRNDETYTYNDIVYLTLESIGFQHSNINGLGATKHQFRDTVEVIFKPSDDYTSQEASQIFNIVYDHLAGHASTFPSQPYYLSSFIRPLDTLTNTQMIEILSVFSTNDQLNDKLTVRGPILPPVNMPSPRYYGEVFDCSWQNPVQGAAIYLRDWILDHDPIIGLSPGQYIGAPKWIVSAKPGEATYISENGTLVSGYITNLMLMDNPDDIIQDGHRDRKTFYYYHNTQNPLEDFLDATCVTPEDMEYYAPNAYNALFNSLNYHGYPVLLALAVEDFYTQPVNHWRHCYWKFYANVCQIKGGLDNPAPGNSF